MFPQMRKVLEGKRFADVEGVKRKAAEALTGIKVDELKHCLEPWETVSIAGSHQRESPVKVTEV